MMRLLIVTLAAGFLFAQDKPAEPKGEPSEAAVIQVKTLTGDSFQRLMKLLNVFGARVQGDSEMRTIVVYAPKDVVEQMRRVVEQLDRPGSQAAIGRNIEMTLTFLRCSPPDAGGSTIMEQVVKQIRAATSCKDARIWDSVPLRLQEGKDASDELRLPGVGPDGQQATVRIWLRPDAVYRKDQGRYVRFATVQIAFKIPVVTASINPANPLLNTQISWNTFAINTSGDFLEGQKTVLGKVSGMGENESIFAVIALKVLD